MIIIETIPHENQRYETVGDWYTDETGALRIRVSKMSDPRYASCVAIHELVEALLCRQAGITEDVVDAFDMRFEADRALGKHGPDDEPGDDPRAPYHVQHVAATSIEHAFALHLGVSWKAYEAEICGMP